MGQGRDNAKNYLAENPEIMKEIEEKVRELAPQKLTMSNKKDKKGKKGKGKDADVDTTNEDEDNVADVEELETEDDIEIDDIEIDDIEIEED